MSRRLYDAVLVLYINGKAVSQFYYDNLKYGEPEESEPTPVADIRDLYNKAEDYSYSFDLQFSRRFDKVKVRGSKYRSTDIKDMYLKIEYHDRKEELYDFLTLAKKLRVPEFIDFCKDKGLGTAAMELGKN